MHDDSTNRFNFIRQTAAEIRADREPKPVSEVRTVGLKKVIAQECERGSVAEGCSWVGHTASGEARAKTR